MSMVTSNRLLPLLAGSVVLMAMLVAVKSCSPSDEQPQLLKAVPQAPKPDADTPADTIKTLTANVSAMTSELNALRRDNTALKQENRDLIEDRKQIENNVLSRVQTALEAKRTDAASSETTSAIAALTARVDSLANRFGTSSTQRSSTGSDIPVGLGLDGVRTSASEAESLVWVNPLELAPSPDADKETLLNRFTRGSRNALDSAGPEVKSLVAKGSEALNTALPVYTVPRNATLIGSTGMTALVGRVPIQGQVRDPMPFKVITGKENLAANGLRIPGIEGMIWSGTAVGDWTLSCVTGKLESVTFVFEDGTIQTISSDEKSSGGNQRGGSSGSSDRPLGWISDARGIPCITGERKTNAPAFLTQRIGVMALEAAGEAAAQAETTTLINDSGSATSVVSGETGKYVLGKTLSGGSDEVAQWLRERQAQSFDAVFVPAGVELAIHVDHELPIDFHSNGRKLHHETNPSNKRRLSLVLVWTSALMVGCASTKETVLPQDGPTMKSIYDQHMVDVQKPDHRRVIGGQPLPQSGIDHYQGFVREAANEIDTVFPRLPNPTLVMYIFPHLSGSERTPVPGYVTTFPFYEKVEYALPGEVPGEVPGEASAAVNHSTLDQ